LLRLLETENNGVQLGESFSLWLQQNLDMLYGLQGKALHKLFSQLMLSVIANH